MPAPPVPPPLRVNRFADMAADIAGVVLDRVADDVPDLLGATWRNGEADREWLATDLARRIELAGRSASLEETDLARFASYVRAAVRRGAPLPSMQRFLRASVAHSLTELWARAEPEDVTELLRLSRWMARHNGAVERMLVQVYCEHLDPDRARTDRREAHAERLLAGVGDGDRTPSTRGWLVVVLAADADVRGEPLRGTPATTSGGYRHVLVPVAPEQRRADVWATAARWVAGHDGVRAAGSFCDTSAGVPDAAATSRRLLQAAAAVALPEGLVGPQDLALETVLVAQPDASRDLAGLLEGLAADERLLETLVAFFAHDLDRTRTAAALFLSRGGLSLRLDRIAQLTRLDPRTTRGIQVLGAALLARALTAADPR